MMRISDLGGGYAPPPSPAVPHGTVDSASRALLVAVGESVSALTNTNTALAELSQSRQEGWAVIQAESGLTVLNSTLVLFEPHMAQNMANSRTYYVAREDEDRRLHVAALIGATMRETLVRTCGFRRYETVWEAASNATERSLVHMLERVRVEALGCQRWPGLSGFLLATAVVEDLPSAGHLVIHGRKYLPVEVRQHARDAWGTTRTHENGDLVADLIDRYRVTTDADEAADVVRSLLHNKALENGEAA